MKLTEKESGQEYTIEIIPAEFDAIRMNIPGGTMVVSQQTALSIARLLEEQIKELRRR